MTPIARAVELLGSQANLARAIKKTPVEVHQWLHGKRPVPATSCRAIEKATGGEVTKEELRPDVFGEPKPRKREAA